MERTDSEKIAQKFKHVYKPEGRYVNDHCFINQGETVHLYHIDGEVGKGCYDIGNETVIGHATSSDLVNWTRHQPALVSDAGLAHEERGVFAPYVIKKGDIYVMLYSSHNMKKAQYICMATSKDLFNWNRYEQNPVIIPKQEYAFWEESKACSCRDPHIFEEDEGYFVYWVADMNKDSEVSCITLSTSGDLINFVEKGPVLEKRHSFDEAFTMKTESPCVIKRHGLYYLFFRHGDGTKYCISDNPGDFYKSETYYLGPSHASEIFEFKNKWYVSSCSREPWDIEHKTDRSRGLYLAGLDFEGRHPVITDFHY